MIFCGVVQKELYGTVCPIKSGHCYWQQRRTKECCYTKEKLDKAEFCELVGIKPTPDEDDIEKIKEKMRQALSEYR